MRGDPNHTRAQTRAATQQVRFEQAGRQREFIIRGVRVVAFVLVVTVVLLNLVGVQDDPGASPEDKQVAIRWWIALSAAVGLFGMALLADILTPTKKLSTVSAIVLGLMAGMLATVAFGFIVDLVATSWGFDQSQLITGTTKLVFGIVMAYLGVVTVLQTQDDFRLVIPYVEFAKQMRGTRPMILDTSAIIDARILEVGETGLIQARIIIPQFVIQELHTLADSGDRMKRTRGRRGLDVVTRLQKSRLDVSLDDTAVPAAGVDQMLIDLAKPLSAVIVTTDTGLDRVAGISGVEVVNLNEVAQALKPAVVPGEPLRVELIKAGEQHGQAVGYLDDGTMVVAEDGREEIGQHVTLTVTSSIQTSAGRMIFGRVHPEDDPVNDPTTTHHHAQPPRSIPEPGNIHRPSEPQPSEHRPAEPPDPPRQQGAPGPAEPQPPARSPANGRPSRRNPRR